MIELGAAVELFLAGAGAANKVLRGKADDRETQQLAIRYWGQVLFELRTNLDGVQQMAATRGAHAYPHLRLRAWDELYGALCKLTPMPQMLATIQQLNDSIEEIAFLLRTAVSAPPTATSAGSLGVLHERGGGDQWDDAFGQAEGLWATKPNVPFNQLRDIVAGAGRQAFGDKQWQVLEPELLPGPF
jgi:hypothetical protein